MHWRSSFKFLKIVESESGYEWWKPWRLDWGDYILIQRAIEGCWAGYWVWLGMRFRKLSSGIGTPNGEWKNGKLITSWWEVRKLWGGRPAEEVTRGNESKDVGSGGGHRELEKDRVLKAVGVGIWEKGGLVGTGALLRRALELGCVWAREVNPGEEAPWVLEPERLQECREAAGGWKT